MGNLTDLAFIGLVLVAVVAVVKPLAAALADRIRHHPEIPAAGTQELLDEMRAMRLELAELAERVDFAERFLAKQSDPQRIGPGV